MADGTKLLVFGLLGILTATVLYNKSWVDRHAGGDGLDGRLTNVGVSAIAHQGVVSLDLGVLNSGKYPTAYDVKMDVHSQSWTAEYQAVTGEVQPGLGTRISLRSGKLRFTVGDPLQVIVRLWTSVGVKVDERTIDIVGGTLAAPPQSRQY